MNEVIHGILARLGPWIKKLLWMVFAKSLLVGSRDLAGRTSRNINNFIILKVLVKPNKPRKNNKGTVFYKNNKNV